jgi:hypothetical protein
MMEPTALVFTHFVRNNSSHLIIQFFYVQRVFADNLYIHPDYREICYPEIKLQRTLCCIVQSIILNCDIKTWNLRSRLTNEMSAVFVAFKTTYGLRIKELSKMYSSKYFRLPCTKPVLSHWFVNPSAGEVAYHTQVMMPCFPQGASN